VNLALCYGLGRGHAVIIAAGPLSAGVGVSPPVCRRPVAVAGGGCPSLQDVAPIDAPLAAPAVPGAIPPPFGPAELLGQARLDSVVAVGVVLAAALYLYGVYRLRARGDRWPVPRTVLFCGPGLGAVAVVTVSGLQAYDTTLLSVHMVQHMVLSMVAPIFLALGAPVTLALRTLPRRPRRALLAVLHSVPVRVLTFPLVAFGLFVVTPFALYFTDLYRLSLANGLVHEWLHLHFIVAGGLFFWPLVGLDPLPGRWPHPGRALLMLLSVPFHTVLGLTIMQSSTLIGGDWYPSLGLAWADPVADQRLAGGVLWAGGEAVSVTMLAVLLVQWMRASEREARRVDRELDRAEIAAGRGHADPAAGRGDADPAARRGHADPSAAAHAARPRGPGVVG
jgi:putative copper resistance protein D